MTPEEIVDWAVDGSKADVDREYMARSLVRDCVGEALAESCPDPADYASETGYIIAREQWAHTLAVVAMLHHHPTAWRDMHQRGFTDVSFVGEVESMARDRLRDKP